MKYADDGKLSDIFIWRMIRIHEELDDLEENNNLHGMRFNI